MVLYIQYSVITSPHNETVKLFIFDWNRGISEPKRGRRQAQFRFSSKANLGLLSNTKDTAALEIAEITDSTWPCPRLGDAGSCPGVGGPSGWSAVIISAHLESKRVTKNGRPHAVLLPCQCFKMSLNGQRSRRHIQATGFLACGHLQAVPRVDDPPSLWPQLHCNTGFNPLRVS